MMPNILQFHWWLYPLLCGAFIGTILLAAWLLKRRRMTREERWRDHYDRRLKKSIRKRGM